MIFKAALSDPDYPDMGTFTVPFPIPMGQYDETIEMLAELNIGDILPRDCMVNEITSDLPVLKRLEYEIVNLDELDYLAKRLGSFDAGETAQFQAAAHAMGLTDIKDLINLTFCCQQVTVINDFRNLESAGRLHVLHLRGGGMSTDEYEKISGETIAKALIMTGEGQITPYGVLYDNGVKLEQVYTGGPFPEYPYDSRAVLGVTVTSRDGPEDARCSLTFPMSRLQLLRPLTRAGINDLRGADVKLEGFDMDISTFDLASEELYGLNEMCAGLAGLDKSDKDKLQAVTELARPATSQEVIRLIEDLDLFDFTPGAKTPEEYGKYMIQQSGHFEYDPNLDEYIDYGGYARRSMANAPGKFTDAGYVSYQGDVPLEELLGRTETPTVQMGGLA